MTRSAVALLALAPMFNAAAEGPVATVLGSAPLCEASAAVPHPHAAEKVLVADNEVSEGLFEFTLVAGRLERQRLLPLPGSIAPSDAEAIASADGVLWVFGSHSRNKRCEIKPRRQRVLAVRLDASAKRAIPLQAFDTSKTWPAVVTSTESCVRALFADPPPPLAHEVCRAIVQAEPTARGADGSCETFNIEGAVALPVAPPGKGSRLWVGLRAPRAGAQAVLLRLSSDAGALLFDGVALVDLEGGGIRELALRGGTIWGISGPPGERPSVGFRAFAIEASRLTDGARLEPEWIPGHLPPSSEALVFDEETAIVLIDGDRGSEGARTCLVPSRQARLEPGLR